MSEVAKLVPKTARCNKVVKTSLSDLAKIADEESLTGIAIAAVDVEGRLWTSYAGGQNFTLLLGAIERLKKRVMDEAES